MADSFGISEAQLLTLFLCSVLWGMLLITSAYCLRYFFFGCPMKEAASLRPHDNPLADARNGPCTVGIFTGLTNWVNILESCNIALGKLISDAILVYRTTLITFPALLCIFSEASQRNNPKVLLTEVAELQVAFTVAWGMSLVNNVITTDNSLYAIRTEASPGRSAHRKTRLQRVIRIIIESGLLYTTSAFITFIHVLGAQQLVLTRFHMRNFRFFSIAFNLIIIRVSTQPSGSESYVIQSSPTFPFAYILCAATNPSIALDTAQSSNEVLRNDSLLDP
ncbi:hypothetical protein BDP27DRAFT_1326125 [Rhodocollybia butyracea]|uniref:Uncharacterized protein n=1 Tax=Rhodocollybia butyracea TaxID=206335 RepID=A0A9P5U7V0_9AGAR|nr:hypothetical protein BDP27DRAFT_1326125 [Rhodocollybia butyracea]